MRLFLSGRMRSVGCAVDGIVYLVRSQRNAWVHLLASVAVIGMGCALRLSVREWCWIVAAMAGVWVAEAMNTAVEVLCDVVCAERHEGIGRVKDVAAGGVLMAAGFAGVIGVVVMGPRLLVYQW
ncbi:MAG TPA: diacylglycerol kinase family protein [Phycisphaerae bacterium]|nr:diacylglycerol kinase family protein [Phycisphaerae bacterium]